jgi:cytosine/adenosine deaminase-related metal-dependent hydrolase
MRDSVALARSAGVRLHTHLAETVDEERFCIDTFGLRPVAYMESLGWLGDDVWFAHAVHVDDAEIATLARSGSGVAHCPTSNMRLASGIAPVARYRAGGVNVGLGVDGSASNDGSHLLAEVRQAMLLARLETTQRPTPGGAALMTAREALELATLGGAAVLGRDDIGSLAPGMCADFFALDLETIPFSGALHDPVAAVVLCAPQQAAFTMVNGRFVVKDGQLTTIDLDRVVEEHGRIARRMVNGP